MVALLLLLLFGGGAVCFGDEARRDVRLLFKLQTVFRLYFLYIIKMCLLVIHAMMYMQYSLLMFCTSSPKITVSDKKPDNILVFLSENW